MNPNQGILPGCEEFFKPTQKRQWNPVPHTLSRVKSYLMGYHVNGRPIKARVKWMADRLGIGRSTFVLCGFTSMRVSDGVSPCFSKPSDTSTFRIAARVVRLMVSSHLF